MVLLFVLAAVSAADEAPAPRGASPEFSAAWKRHQEGGDATELFTKIAENEEASTRDRFNASYLLATISLGKGEPERALEHLDAADRHIADRPQVALRRADALRELDRLPEAVKSLKRVKLKKSAPLYPRFQLSLARLEEAGGSAEHAYDRVVALSKVAKDDWEVFFTLGTLSEKRGQVKEALAAYERVIELDPKRDPFPGIYAYQRHAALSIASNGDSYQRRPLIDAAVEKYGIFLKRAAANQVPAKLIQTTLQAKQVLEYFRK